MKAVVFKGNNRIAVEEVPDPRIEHSGDALIRVTTAAICGTDIHVKHGTLPGIAPGTVIGHEFVGVVEEVGRDVTRFKPGDRIDSPPALWCGICPACHEAVVQNCDMISMWGGGDFMSPMGLNGVHAELVRVPRADLVLTPIPESVPDDQAILVGDMFVTGYHCATEAQIRTGDTVVVSGCGPVGLCALLSAWQFGPKEVLAVDMYDNRLAVAEKYGAVPVDIRLGDPVEKVMERTGGRGAECVLEASGNSKAFLAATKMIKKWGSVSCVGLYPEPVELPIQDIIYRGMRLGMGLGNITPLPRLMQLVEYGRVDLSPIATHKFALADALEAYDLFENHKEQCLKVLLKP